jgi:hypothetical protein
MSTEIKIQDFTSLLPSLSNYSKSSNAFLSDGYSSQAGNTYFNAIRFAEGIIIKEDVGQGHFHTFLNAIRIYSIKDKVLLADKSFHTCYYTKDRVFFETKKLLVDLILETANSSEQYVDKPQLESKIEKVLSNAFKGNQIEIVQNQLRNQLG